ncbi:MAG: hypothetical protein NWF06_09020 [Candidatus Bathyarchaeota archaeon]|nr:hypothetical protein [Candidatus Bathyarchaeum sp.]
MVETLFNDVLHTVSTWNPKAEYLTERKYRDDLLEFLQEQLNSDSTPYSSAIWGLDPLSHHFVKKEAGRSLADIAIDNEIGIELKRNLKHKSQINRLVGQVVDYLNAYSCVIIVLCGRTEREAVSILKYNLKTILKSFSSHSEEEKLVTIILKSNCNKTRKTITQTVM